MVLKSSHSSRPIPLPTESGRATADDIAANLAAVQSVALWPSPVDDDGATLRTLQIMRNLAEADAASPAVAAAVSDALAAGGPVEDAIFNWVRSHLVYVEDARVTAGVLPRFDPSMIEYLTRPAELLAMPRPAEDCDGYAMLTWSMLRRAGLKPGLVAIEADPRHPGLYTHVSAMVAAPRRLMMDTTYGDRPGWEATSLGKVLMMEANGNAVDLGAVPTWVQGIIETGVKAGTQIATARYGQAPVGTYQQTGADGSSVFYRQAPGASALTFPGVNVQGNYSGLLVAGGLLVVGLLVMKAAKG